MSFTDAGENFMADMVRGVDLVLPTDWFLALGSSANDTGIVELTGTGYARVAVARGLATWSGTQGQGTTIASSGNTHSISNNDLIYWGVSGSAWGDANFVGVFDEDDVCWMWLPHPAPQSIGNGETVQILADELIVTLGVVGGMSDHLSNRLLDKLFRAGSYVWPANTYAKLFTSEPTNAGGGDEVIALGYVRQVVESSLDAWGGTGAPASNSPSSGADGRISNNNALVWSNTIDDVTVTHGGLQDALTGGNLLFWAELANPKSIRAGGDPLTFPADSFSITWD